MPVKLIATAVTTKGIVISATVLFVIQSRLTDFEKALIITVVGATITGIFTVLGTVLAVRITKSLHSDIQDVKAKVGANQRTTDAQEEP